MDNMIDPSEAGWKPFTQPGFVGLVGPLEFVQPIASAAFDLDTVQLKPARRPERHGDSVAGPVAIASRVAHPPTCILK